LINFDLRDSAPEAFFSIAPQSAPVNFPLLSPERLKPGGRGVIQTERAMAQHTLTPRQYLTLAFVSVSAPLGDTLLSRGMTHMPPISLSAPGALIAAVFTPWVAAGIAMLIAFFASYLTALSWADLTFVLPATALGNVLVALFSRFWLHEIISLERWAGIALITLGVGFVAQGPSRTEQPVRGMDGRESKGREPERREPEREPDVKDPPAKQPDVKEPPAEEPDVPAQEPGGDDPEINEPEPDEPERREPEPKEIAAR
jgi:uncharacterized protein (DUF486 family)